jgi:hypothetical protein
VYFTPLAGRNTGNDLIRLAIHGSGSASNFGTTSGVRIAVEAFTGFTLRQLDAGGPSSGTTFAMTNGQEYCLEVFRTEDASNRVYVAQMTPSTNGVKNSGTPSVSRTITTLAALPSSQTLVQINGPTVNLAFVTITKVESISSGTPPTGAITTETVSGQSVTVAGTTANAPTSGTATLNTGTGTPQGPISVTLGSGTFTTTFTDVPPGTYTPSVTLSNDAGQNNATGATELTVTGVGGGGEPGGGSPPPPSGSSLKPNIARKLAKGLAFLLNYK